MNALKNSIRAAVAFVLLGIQFVYSTVTGSDLVPVCYANTIDANLKLNLILDAAMVAFTEMLTPLALFSTAFYDIPLKGTDKVEVPYYPLETAASKDFDGTYKFDVGSNTQSKEITVDRRKYQSLAWTSSELRRQPKLDPEQLGRMKGQKLAEDVLADIWGLITNANYGAAVFTGAATDFDVDDVIDIEVACNVAKWPNIGRGLILAPAYTGGLKKDMNANGGMATFARDGNGALINFPGMHSFSFANSNLIPGNAENLVGFASYMSAILIGFSPIEPAPEVMEKLSDYRVVSNDMGLSLEYRAWGDADTDTAKRTLEVNYGRSLGEVAALKRIVSA